MGWARASREGGSDACFLRFARAWVWICCEPGSLVGGEAGRATASSIEMEERPSECRAAGPEGLPSAVRFALPPCCPLREGHQKPEPRESGRTNRRRAPRPRCPEEVLTWCPGALPPPLARSPSSACLPSPQPWIGPSPSARWMCPSRRSLDLFSSFFFSFLGGLPGQGRGGGPNDRAFLCNVCFSVFFTMHGGSSLTRSYLLRHTEG